MGRAFHVYDPDGWHWMNVNFGGLILGAILNVIVAQTAMRLPSISATFASLKVLMPKASKKADKKEDQARSRALKKLTLAMKQNIYSQVGFYILLGFSALMVAPALYILWTKTLPFHPIFIGIMAGVGAVAPDVAITVGGFAASDSERRSATKSATQSGAGADGSAKGAGAVRSKPNRSADAVRIECAALSAQYACTEAQCGWSPSVDALIASASAGKSAKNSASSAKAGHMKNKHPKSIVIDQSLLIDPAKKNGGER
jgi:hypothetical protein